ncbi:hypothetical protein PA18A_3629 [Pseudomonas aeruginosa 18A]|nr:hypothetical protein PA18A_3629 [Pseudomonas aeruginosa 18A]
MSAVRLEHHRAAGGQGRGGIAAGGGERQGGSCSRRTPPPGRGRSGTGAGRRVAAACVRAGRGRCARHGSRRAAGLRRTGAAGRWCGCVRPGCAWPVARFHGRRWRRNQRPARRVRRRWYRGIPRGGWPAVAGSAGRRWRRLRRRRPLLPGWLARSGTAAPHRWRRRGFAGRACRPRCGRRR